MRVNRLEEILEECVSAHAQGRRSLAESLALYPGLRSELEPLLRTALSVSGSFASATPSDAAVQRGLNRFLSDARARNNLKAMNAQTRSGWFSGMFVKYRTGFAGAAVALAAIAVAVGVASFGGGDDSDGPPALSGALTPGTSAPATNTPELVSDLSLRIASARGKIARGETIELSEIQELSVAARQLTAADADEIAGNIAELTQTLQNLDTLLQDIVAVQPAVAAEPAVQEAQETTREVAGVLGIELTSPTPIVETPVPTDGSGETPVATDAPPTDAPTLGPTTEPTSAPTPEPTPTEIVRPVS